MADQEPQQGDFWPFKKLLRMVIRAFYPERCPPAHYVDANDDMAKSRMAKIDTTGLGVVIMDYLIDREWVAEEQICRDLGQHHKILRRALKYLEHEHFLVSHSQRETRRSQKRDVVKQMVNSHTQQLQEIHETGGPKAAGEGDEDEEAQQKQHTYSYWAVDYPRAVDMIQLRLHTMKRTLKDELDAKEVVAKYLCKAYHCAKEYTSYDILDILQPDGSMACVMCGANVEQVLASGQTGGDEELKARRERLTKLLKSMEAQLSPIIQLAHQLKPQQPPHHGTIQDWARLQQARVQAATSGGPGGPDAPRGRTVGGITQLTEAKSAAKTKLYQETHVQITLAPAAPAAGAAGPSAAAAAGAAGSGLGAAAAGGVALGPAPGAKAPSLQPFFLKSGGAAAAGSGSQGPAKAATQQAQQDAYSAQMLALMSGSNGAGTHAADEDTRAAKRARVDEPPTETKHDAGNDGDEWEDI